MKILRTTFVLGMIFACVSGVHAVDYYWNNAGGGAFTDAGQWTPSLDASTLTNTDLVYVGASGGGVNNSGDVTFGNPGTSMALKRLNIGSGPGATGQLTITDATNITLVGEEFNVGHAGGTGTLVMTGGSFNLGNTRTYWGNNDGSSATGHLSGGSLTTNIMFSVGTHGSTTLNISGTHKLTLTGADGLYLGYGIGNATGTVNQSGGTVDATGSSGIIVSGGGTSTVRGVYNLTGGELLTNNFYIRDHANGNTTGELKISQANAAVPTIATIGTLAVNTEVSGGKVTITDLNTPFRGGSTVTNAFTQTGGEVSITNLNTTANLTGGVLDVTTVNGTLNQTSGTLAVGGASNIDTMTIANGGAYNATLGIDYSTNLVRGHDASQSSVWAVSSTDFYPTRAVDGNYGTRAHTANATTQWWQVDLVAPGAPDRTPVEVWAVKVNAQQSDSSPTQANYEDDKRRHLTPYYFETYDGDLADLGESTGKSQTFTSHEAVTSDNNLATQVFGTGITGTVLRLVRDVENVGDNIKPAVTSMNIYEVEAYGRLPAGVLQMEIDGALNDIIHLENGASLNLDDVILELSLTGPATAGTWTLFTSDDDYVTDWSAMLSGVTLALPTITGYDWDPTNFYSSGVLGLSANGSGSSVPEPATWLMLALGVVGLCFTRRKNNR